MKPQMIEIDGKAYFDDYIMWNLAGKATERDAIVVHNPRDARAGLPGFPHSIKTLEEHIAYIKDNNIKSAILVADDIGFIKECPQLEYVAVYPSQTSVNFDYSPLYEMPNIKWAMCATTVGINDVWVASVDYSQFKGLEYLSISYPDGHNHVEQAGDIRSLSFQFGFPKAKNLQNKIPGRVLRDFSITEAPIQSLDGIEAAPNLCRLELSHNRKLTDISALRHLSDSLGYLEINSCGKIKDFSVLSELHNVEFLVLKGSNVLADLSFLKKMSRLKYLDITMNVEDGDLSLCGQVPYVSIKNRKHYSHKDTDLPKNFIDPNDAYPFYK